MIDWKLSDREKVVPGFGVLRGGMAIAERDRWWLFELLLVDAG